MRDVLPMAGEWDEDDSKEEVNMLAPAMLFQSTTQTVLLLFWVALLSYGVYAISDCSSCPSSPSWVPSGLKFFVILFIAVLVWLGSGIALMLLLDGFSRWCCLVPGMEKAAFAIWYYRTKLIRRGRDQSDSDGIDM